MAIIVNVDNFVRAETHRMFTDIQRAAGGVGRFRHNRQPTSIDEQTVIRMNRDTLYSFAIVDLAETAWLSLPDPGGRYMSAMVVNEDHYINVILHASGRHQLTRQRCGSRYVLVGVRILVDPLDPDDVAAVGALQDRITLESSSDEFAAPEYDTTSLDKTRDALLALASGLTSFERTFGSPDEVDPVHHLIGTAAGWGGLPTSEASYVGVDPGVPPGSYELTFKDVPVDAFWSVSVYNAAGFFEPNPHGLYTVNSVTGVPGADGSITVHFTADPGENPPANCIITPEGWNYLVRLYRPREEFFAGTWTLPSLSPINGT
ncbi:DUF1214 domain-containing protein [Mycobacterium sp. Marseille-P9652]|uniref:DUF1214 domain-containing protein n=1 Tax=Mycobacterium sp. Marseille-P9652 TaxID=2654950 RepID=UPI0012E8B4E6|nr:DUF1214 domain-containing protein [Mycobacterium sp. Marseille-P9652]